MQGDWEGAAIAAGAMLVVGLGAGEAKLGAEVVEEGVEYIGKETTENVIAK